MSWRGSGGVGGGGLDSVCSWLSISNTNLHFFLSLSSKWLQIQKQSSLVGKQMIWFNACAAGARRVCVCAEATVTQVAPLCISYSCHDYVFVFCAAGIASDTLNQLPPPTPTIHPRAHMWALVKLMPLGHTRALSLRQPLSLIGVYCNSNGNIFW